MARGLNAPAAPASARRASTISLSCSRLYGWKTSRRPPRRDLRSESATISTATLR